MIEYKIIYTIISSLLIFFLASCFILSLRRHNRLFNIIGNTQFATVFTILFMLYAINCKTIQLAEIFYSLFYVMQFVLMIVILRLVLFLEEKNNNSKVERIIRYVFYGISFVEIVFFIAKPNLFFALKPLYVNNELTLWEIHYTKLFIVHQSLVSLFSIRILIILIVASSRNHKIYRRKFTLFLILFLMEYLCECCFNLNTAFFKINPSPLICGAISIYLFYYAVFEVPKAVRNNMLAVASETISDAVICFDNRGKCLYANKSARKIYTPDESVWINKYLNASEDVINCEDKFEIDGEVHTYKVEFKKIWDDKLYSGAYIKLVDITLELNEIDHEEYRATHDELTGLANRSAFFAQCEQIINKNPEVQRYLIATNIKNFKLINDLFGSKFGDNLLKRQADMLNRANYSDCVKGRISGDKFAMLISKENFSPEKAQENTDYVREMGQNVSFPITLQLGVYEIADTTEKVYTMYNKALLAIKNNAETRSLKCSFSYYDTSLTNKILYEQNIIAEFKYALKDNNFHVFIQAQVDSKTESCKGGEALVRWYDPNALYRQPGEFISILEKSGLIYKLDLYVWEKTAQILNKWNNAGHKDFYLSVNISAKDFYYADLYKVFTNLVEKYDIPPSQLNLELTESAVIDKNSPHKKVIQQLREFGFRIEMDDFGSGYSSLNVLKEIEMDVLKIDMEFLHASENESRGKSIIASIVKMAKALGMKIIAEGVENEEQKNYLKEIGVDYYQGYFFSKPIELSEFEKKYLGGSL